MKTIELKLYSFNELSDQAKEKAINKYYNINTDFEWWHFIYSDAKENGLKIKGFNIDRGNYCNAEFIYSGVETMNLILSNCGLDTELYALANNFKNDFNKLVKQYSDEINIEKVTEENFDDFDDDLIDLENEFNSDLEEQYLIILRNEYEYLISNDAISEALINNEYDFTEDGNKY